MPTPKDPQMIIEEFRNHFGNYGLFQNEEYAGYTDVLSEVEDHFRSSLISLLEYIEGEMPTKGTILDKGLTPYERAYEVGRWKVIDDMSAKIREIKDSI